MDEVRLLDTSLRVATGEIEGNCVGCEDSTIRRKKMDAFVRRGLKYDPSKHRSAAEYDGLIVAETERRLRATGIEGSEVVSGVVSMLKEQGASNPGELPPDPDQDRRKQGAGASTMRAGSA